MNRRKFLKFMSVTPAAAAATTVLAKLPEIEPKIELLQPKKIITDSNEVLVFNRVVDYRYTRNENHRVVPRLGSTGARLNEGRLESMLLATVYLEDPATGNTIGPMSDAVSQLHDMGDRAARCRFTTPELSGKLFILRGFEIIANLDSALSAKLNCSEISVDGWLL